MKALTTLFVAGMFLTTVAMADDVDDVKAAVQGYFAALSAGDWNALSRYRMPEHSSFGPGPGLLVSERTLLKSKGTVSRPTTMLVKDSTYRSGT